MNGYEEQLNKIIKEELNKIIDKNLDNEIEEGKKLKQSCEYFKSICSNNDCVKNGHKQKVCEYIYKVEKQYKILIGIYAKIKGITNGKNISVINCNSLENYIKFLEDLKRSKEISDDIDKVIEILKENSK